MVNVVAILASIKWQPLAHDRWIHQNGDTWVINNIVGCPTHLFVHALQDAAALVLWSAAGSHYNDRGLEGGIHWAASTSLLRKRRKAKEHSLTGAIETVLCGGYWSPDGVIDAALVDPDQDLDSLNCHLCGEHAPDDLHQFWTCPRLADSQDVVVQKYMTALAFGCVAFFLLPAQVAVQSPCPRMIPPCSLLVIFRGRLIGGLRVSMLVMPVVGSFRPFPRCVGAVWGSVCFMIAPSACVGGPLLYFLVQSRRCPARNSMPSLLLRLESMPATSSYDQITR